MKPLPPCTAIEYTGWHSSVCLQPSTGWLGSSHYGVGDRCQVHREEVFRTELAHVTHVGSDAGELWLAIRLRELVYRMRWGSPSVHFSEFAPRLTSQVCPTCHGHGQIWIDD